MTSSIEPPRRSPRILRMGKAAAARPEAEDEDVDAVEASQLPIPVSPARAIPPQAPRAGAATIQAQVIGERRGLRAGANVHDQARVTYNRTEWSGSRDRRAPKGRATKTDV